jgi:hypothetical protein
VTAFLPGDGQALLQLAEGDPDELVQRNLIVDEAAGVATVAEEALRDAFYGECSDDDGAWAMSRLVPESLSAMAAPVHVTAERAGSIRRTYVECTLDRAITIGKQREMLAAQPCANVVTTATDHSPFLSKPQELAGHLLAAAG